MLRAKQYIVQGRVQGVGYRFFVVQAAGRCGIHGYVRNLGSGDVEVWAEGEELSLRAFHDELVRGPRSARVTGVLEEDLPATGAYYSFLIRG
jgi:acylphosphatase